MALPVEKPFIVEFDLTEAPEFEWVRADTSLWKPDNTRSFRRAFQLPTTSGTKAVFDCGALRFKAYGTQIVHVEIEVGLMEDIVNLVAKGDIS